MATMDSLVELTARADAYEQALWQVMFMDGRVLLQEHSGRPRLLRRAKRRLRLARYYMRRAKLRLIRALEESADGT